MQFVARVGTPEGRVVEETHAAQDEVSLRRELEKRGLHIFELRRRGLGRGLALSGISGRRRVDVQRFLAFNQELAALLKAGLPLLQSLDLMVGRMAPDTFRSVLSEVRERVRTGQDLSEAFGAHRELFPRLYPSILKAGERSGELELVLRRFIRYQKLVLEARKRVVSALVYPAVLVTVSAVMILVMLIFVVPKFELFFEGSGAELPLLTRTMLAIGTTLESNGLWLAVALLGGGIFFWRWKETPAGGLALDRLRLRLPFLGPVLHRFALSEFCRSLATLLAGGMPLVPSLEIAVSAVGNAQIREQLEPTIQKVREGEPFHQSLEQSGVFTDLAIDMVQVGEATGGLDEMLANVSDFFDDQVETRMQRLLTLVEPAMLVFMGIVVALILISLYLPLFSALSQTQT
ncbi:MAG TPA: type II secretion system F family protein [Thermoanaerobaculia bacterium]|nr:type II secretion system F family protein [Thermoanaerobaculia bacterium]